MFDARKIQEQVIVEAVGNKSDTETAKEINYGHDGAANSENNANWVKSTMLRLENKFDQETAIIRCLYHCKSTGSAW